MDPRFIKEAIQTDRFVDVGVAEIIEKLMHYRRRNSEGVYLSEHLCCTHKVALQMY